MKHVLTAVLFAAPVLLTMVARSQQPPPAPTEDRIGFPQGYADRFKLWYVYDRPDTRQVRTIYANDLADSVDRNTQSNYPYGSIFVMETWPAVRGVDGNPVLDANGRYQKDPALQPSVFVMKKDRGFGVAYGPNRTGEWEYVAYRADGTYLNRPEQTAGCAVCHLQANAAVDWVFRADLKFRNHGEGPATDGVIHNYKFIPGEMRVKAGSKVTFYNADEIEHTITDVVAGGGTSGRMSGGRSITLSFTERGEFNFQCSIHPSMRGKIIVE